MPADCGKVFDSIESAHDFVGLLAEAVRDAKQEIESDVQNGATNGRRHIEALRMAAYCLEKLQLHMTRSSRILNDLRTLRRLMNEERKPRAPQAVPRPAAVSPPPAAPAAVTVSTLPVPAVVAPVRARAAA